MRCSRCGNEVQDGIGYCNYCGNDLSNNINQQMNVQNQGAVNGYNQNQYGAANGYNQNQYGAANGYNQNQYGAANGYNPNQYGNTAPALGMKWYKFVIYCQLFLTMLFSLINSIQLFSGSVYGGKMEKELVYEIFSSMKALDIIIALLYIGLGVYAFLVRMQLAGFKKNGPKLYYILCIASMAINLIYAVTASIIVKSSSGMSLNVMGRAIFQTVAMGALLVANYIYFGKRKQLFTN